MFKDISKMMKNILFPRNYSLSAIIRRNKSENVLDIKKLEQETPLVEVVAEESKLQEDEIERKRNKSRLHKADYNLLHDKLPYPEPTMWFHGTLKYQRKMYGRYGEASGFNPSLCWPTKTELEDIKEYERVAFPFTIQEMVKTAQDQEKAKYDALMQRQADIVEKVGKLEQWKKELRDKIAKKEHDALQAKMKKERLIEEVRRYFGYKVDPKDEKFKEMLEKKEKEQKKMQKEARRKEKEEKMIAKLLHKQETTVDTS